MTILLTGGAGFIGANFIYFELKTHPEDRIVCLDALTYAGNLSTLAEATEFVRVIQNRQGIEISAPEEIAFRNGWTTKEELLKAAKRYGKSPYGVHLRQVADGKVMG